MSGLVNHAKGIAQEVAKEVAGNPEVLSIALRGSLVTGHFTERSDIDLFAITKSGNPSFEVREKHGMSVHIRYFPQEFVRKLLNLGNIRTMEFVINSEILYDEKHVFKELKETLGDFPSNAFLADLLKTALHFINDAQAQLEAGNHENAVFMARSAAAHITKALLFMNQIKSFKDKEILPSLKAIEKQYTSFAKMYRQIQGLSAVDKSAAEQVLFDTLRMYDIVSTFLQERCK